MYQTRTVGRGPRAVGRGIPRAVGRGIPRAVGRGIPRAAGPRDSAGRGAALKTVLKPFKIRLKSVFKYHIYKNYINIYKNL